MYLCHRSCIPHCGRGHDLDGPPHKLQRTAKACQGDTKVRRCVRRHLNLAMELLILVATASSLATAANCPETESAAKAIDQWQASRSIRLSNAARAQFIAGLCEAADAVTRDHQISRAKVAAATHQTTEDYLDRVTRTDVRPRTIVSTLSEHLGYAGLARPVANPYGLLSIDYLHAVDYLNIGGERHEPSPKFLVLAGPTVVEGYARGKSVCTVKITVFPAASLSVSC
jgi:hypothetical protein